MFNFLNKKSKDTHHEDFTKSYIDRLDDLFNNINSEQSTSSSITPRACAYYYKNNPIVFKCIELISSSIANIKIDAYSVNEEKIHNHPALFFLKNPSPIETESTFFYKLSTWFLIFGEVFVQKIYKNNQIIRLNIINPLQVETEANGHGFIIAYKLGDIRYTIDQLTGEAIPVIIAGVQSTLYTLKSIDSVDSVRGLSKLSIAKDAIESFMSALEWNKNLLKNRAIPASVLEQEGIGLAHSQVEHLQEEMKKFRGAKNAGKWMLVPPGIKISPLALSPTEMDFKQMLDKMSEYIASVLGVPPILISLSNSTFNNVSEAKISLYRETVLPLYTRILEFITIVLKPHFRDVVLGYNEDDIGALWEERKAKIESMTTAVGQQLLSIDEGRKELGYEEKGGLAADLFIRSGSVPLELVNETQGNQDPDNNNEEESEIDANQETTDEGRS